MAYDCKAYIYQGYCMLRCEMDSECPGNKLCMQYADTPGDWQTTSTGYCAPPCSSDAQCANLFVPEGGNPCVCQKTGELQDKCVYSWNNKLNECLHLEGQP